ncbi:DEAD/DEAH box helicase, partial [Actinomyces sp. MRS3W]|nr:DEAD/DEAH box helicase [Actinomyces sp. MRS3W]
VEALAEAIAALEGVWLPAELWETVVFPARVADYRPAMLDDLVASGEVIWVCRRQDGATADLGPNAASTPAGGGDAALGDIAFFPSDSPFAPVGETRAEPGTLDGSDQWELVRAGRLTADSFQPVRMALQPRPSASPARRVRSRRVRRYGGYRAGYRTGRAMPTGGHYSDEAAATQGRTELTAVLAAARWRHIRPAQVSDEEQALAVVESLLDRYGVITRDVALAAGVPGGLGPVLPVLRRLEDTGAVLRGRFVSGLGPAQFAGRETVDRLRSLADTGEGAPEPPVVVDLKDPACLVGGVVAWPEPTLPPGLESRAAQAAMTARAPRLPRPTARQGTRLVLAGGRPVLYAAEHLRTLTCYTHDLPELESALRALVAVQAEVAGRPGTTRKLVVESLNGISALNPAVGELLQGVGLVRDPKGMRLYIDPYRRR